MSEQSAEPVTVQILDREYRVMCQPDERRSLMEAALFLDRQMREVRDGGKVMSGEKIAVMCALNLADDLLKVRQQLLDRSDQVDGRISELAGRLDKALGGKVD